MTERQIIVEHPLAQGTVVPATELWEFPEGLIGLPEHRDFALLPLPGAEPFRLLASADDPSFGLVLVEPTVLVPDYVLTLSPEELSPLPAGDPDGLQVLVPVVLPSEDGPLTLNLKGPLVLDASARRGVQRVSPDETHALRHTPDPARLDAASSSCSS